MRPHRDRFYSGLHPPEHLHPHGHDPEEQRYILAHERTHLDKGDHWFKMVGFLALALHWFNPLVWLAFYLMNMDCEMSCDEKVVKLLGERARRYIPIHCWKRLPAANGNAIEAVPSVHFYLLVKIM